MSRYICISEEYYGSEGVLNPSSLSNIHVLDFLVSYFTCTVYIIGCFHASGRDRACHISIGCHRPASRFCERSKIVFPSWSSDS
jgi:hypothetical protein